MTTNVFDISQGILASDSRWSIPRDFGIIYVDDTGFDKMELALGHAFIFAGNGAVIQSWKNWIRDPNRPYQEPDVNGIALCIVNVTTVEISFEYGQDIALEEARFAGTGSYHAHLCWSSNKCARRAVESAKGEDKLTGGEIKFIELRTGSHNLTNQGSIDSVAQDIVDRGWVMYNNGKNSRTSIKIDEAAANDTRVADLIKDIATGSVTATAPCDSMYNKWSDADKQRLRGTLDAIFARS